MSDAARPVRPRADGAEASRPPGPKAAKDPTCRSRWPRPIKDRQGGKGHQGQKGRQGAKATKATKKEGRTRPPKPTKAVKETKAAKAAKATKATKATKGRPSHQDHQGGQGGWVLPGARTTKTAPREEVQGLDRRRGPPRRPGPQQGPAARRPPAPEGQGDRCFRRRSELRPPARGADSDLPALNDPMTFLTFVADHPVGAPSTAPWSRSPPTVPMSTWGGCFATFPCGAWPIRRRTKPARCWPRGRPGVRTGVARRRPPPGRAGPPRHRTRPPAPARPPVEPGLIVTSAPVRADDYLPHRPPFLFVTELVRSSPASSATGRWHLTGEEAFFAGHFPGRPTLPGC